AEDGIGGFHVTGFQTCALRICGGNGGDRLSLRASTEWRVLEDPRRRAALQFGIEQSLLREVATGAGAGHPGSSVSQRVTEVQTRSEEGREGEGWRDEREADEQV